VSTTTGGGAAKAADVREARKRAMSARMLGKYRLFRAPPLTKAYTERRDAEDAENAEKTRIEVEVFYR
jgi:hypothetical protein